MGIYIGFIIVLCFKLGNFFYIVDLLVIYLVVFMFFGIVFVFIIYGGVELFIGNIMYFIVVILRKEIMIFDILCNWVVCYVGNLVGVLFFVLLFYVIGIFEVIDYGYLMSKVVEGKMNIFIM